MTTATLEQLAMPAPKFATPRDPSARSDGQAIAAIAQALGKRPMPWQRYVYDVATEREADGRYRYEIVLVTVPRQSGKTTLVGPVMLHRAMTMRGSRTFYTAQTAVDAKKRMLDLQQLIKGSPLEAGIDARLAAGDMGLNLWTGSQVRTFAPGHSALHGETPPLVVLDEIWHYDELLGDAMLEGAILPAQVTLEGRRQVWMISTAGTAASTFMRKWVERGRQAAAGGSEWPRLAYFEWGLPDGADPYDPDTLAAFHPAIGHTISVETLMQMSVGHATWLRAFCNTWVEAAEPLVPLEDWRALAVPADSIPLEQRPDRSSIAITYEIAADNSAGVVMASWRDDDGHPHNRLLHAAPGTRWMHDLLVQLYREWRPAAFGADDGGPTRRLTDELRRTLGDAELVTTTGARDFATACDAWLTAVRERQLRHDGSTTLERGIANLVLKRVGDLQRFSRSDSAGSIAGPVAAAVGLWLYDHQQASYGLPQIIT